MATDLTYNTGGYATGDSSTASVAGPTATDGDVLVICVAAIDGSSAPTFSGYAASPTLVETTTYEGGRIHTCWHECDGTETGNITATLSASGEWFIGYILFDGASADVKSVVAFNTDDDTNGGTLSIGNSAGTGDAVAAFATSIYSNDTFTFAGGLTESFDQAEHFAGAYETGLTAGATGHTASFDGTTEARAISVLVRTSDAGGGGSGITLVGGSYARDSNGPNISTDLSSLDTGTIAAGDVALLSIHKDQDDGTAHNQSAGDTFTQIHFDESTAGRDRSTSLWYRVLDGTETTVTFADTADTSEETSVLVSVWRGVDNTTPFDVTWSTAAHYTEGQNNYNGTPDAITTVTDGAVVVISQCITHDDITTAGAPSGYTIAVDGTGTTRDHAQQIHVYKTVATAGTETPGAFTHTVNNTVAEANFRTVALRPEAAVDIDNVHARYPLDDTSGLPQDASGNDNHFTATFGSPTYRAAGPRDAGSYALEMAEGVVYTIGDANTVASDAADFSIALWAKFDNFVADSVDSDDADIFMMFTGAYNTNGFRFWVGSENETAPADSLKFHNNEDIGFGTADGAVWDSGASLDDNTWRHFAATYDHSTREVKLYVNGALVETATLTTAITDAAGDWKLNDHYRGAGGDATFDAAYAEILITTDILTLTEVKALYDGDWPVTGTNYDGTAATPAPAVLDSSASLQATGGTSATPAPAALAATGSLQVNYSATSATPAPAAIASSASLQTSGTSSTPAPAALDSTATLQASHSGTSATPAPATLEASATLQASYSGTSATPAPAVLDASASLQATGPTSATAAPAALDSSATLQASYAGTSATAAPAALDASGSLQTAGAATTPANATIAATATREASAGPTTTAAPAVLAASASLQTAGTSATPAPATLAATGSLQTAGTSATAAPAVLDASATHQAALGGASTIPAPATLEATASRQATGPTSTIPAPATLGATGSLQANYTATSATPAPATLDATGSLQTAGTSATPAGAALEAIAGLGRTATVEINIDTAPTATSSRNAYATATLASPAVLVHTGSRNAAAVAVLQAPAALAGSAVLNLAVIPPSPARARIYDHHRTRLRAEAHRARLATEAHRVALETEAHRARLRTERHRGRP